MRSLPSLGILFAIVALNGCTLRTNESLTTSEATEALDETSASTQASDLTSASIDIATNFTLGQAAAQAAQNLQAFIVAELPCADITLSGATLTVVYGAKLGACTYNGHTFSGQQTITILPNSSGVEVDHTWTNFSNGIVMVTGTAEVTWNLVDPSRHVVHDLTWTRVWDNVTGHGRGDRTQTPLAGGIAVGMEENGTRTWDGASGHYSLTIDSVQMRWADPVPQSGTYTLVTPSLKSATMDFTRVDDATIAVDVASGRSHYTFDVTEVGAH